MMSFAFARPSSLTREVNVKSLSPKLKSLPHGVREKLIRHAQARQFRQLLITLQSHYPGERHHPLTIARLHRQQFLKRGTGGVFPKRHDLSRSPHLCWRQPSYPQPIQRLAPTIEWSGGRSIMASR
jgi:hypothetical protein